MIRFSLVLVASALVLSGITLFACRQLWIEQLPSFFYQTITILLFGTITIFAYLYRINKPDFFVQLYLLSMAVKFLAYGAYNLMVILKDRDGAAANVVFFMILYIVFTALEIAFLYRKISRSER